MVENAIIVYSRFGSKRLPGKALKSLGHYKLLEFIILRLKILEESKNFKLIVATTSKKEDDEIVQLSKHLNVTYFRGDENNLIKRTIDLLQKYEIKYFCRVNGDCPMVDIDLILQGYNLLTRGNKFVSNIIKRTYPYGIALEWVCAELYRRMASMAAQEELEHVTKHIYRHLHHITYANIENKVDYSQFSFTIDTELDLLRIRKILSKYSKNEQIILTFKQIVS